MKKKYINVLRKAQSLSTIKFAALFIILIFFLTSVAFGQGLQSSGLKTSSAAIVPGPCFFYGVEIITDGTNPATVIVYDHASAASGTEAFKGTVAGTNNFGGILNAMPVNMQYGIYATVSGTGAAFIIYYRSK